MPLDQYFVVLHEGEWKIKHDGQHSGPYSTQREAIRYALAGARESRESGQNAQVLVQGEDLLFRTEWTYGRDPYPPPG